MSNIRTRFAPSPTGFLHIGGVRTALFNYLFAKNQDGKFILRLEDTDQERFVREGVEQIVEALEWLGLEPDEGFWISGNKHKGLDFVQSKRQEMGMYQKYADKLVQMGLAYYSPTSPQQLDAFRQAARKQKKPFIYRKELDEHNSGIKIENVPIRLDIRAFFNQVKKNDENFWKSKEGKWNIRWSEPTGREQAGWNAETIDDFIIIKADGFPTYNLANVIDDHEMKITHVMRGDEFISSTPKHIILYHALGFKKLPEFVHLPVINGTDGKKLSKRTGDTNALDYRDKGYLPKALLNFLVLLGWNDGTEQEKFSLSELEEKFKVNQINTSPAVFDQKRLDWLSGRYIRELDLDKLYKKVSDFWPEEASTASDSYKKNVLGLVQERLKYFMELPELTKFFFVDLPVNPELISNHKKLKKMESQELKALLLKTKKRLQSSDFSKEDLVNQLNELLEETNQKPAVLFSLIRIATTQAPASPGLAETMSVLGRETSLRRVDMQLKELV